MKLFEKFKTRFSEPRAVEASLAVRHGRSVMLASGIALAVVMLMASGCGGKEKASRPDYRSTSSRAPLEVPPGLKRNGSRAESVGDSADPGTYSAYESQASVDQQGSSSSVLPSYENLRMLRSEDERWLEIDGDPQDLWPLGSVATRCGFLG